MVLIVDVFRLSSRGRSSVVIHFLSRIMLLLILCSFLPTAAAGAETCTEWVSTDLGGDGRHFEEIAASKLLLVENGLRADFELTAAIAATKSIGSTFLLEHSKRGLRVYFEV